jgi:hypothetical protein
MAGAVSYSALGAVLKKIFQQPNRVIDACFKNHPFYKRVRKEEGFGGGLSTTSAPYAAGVQHCPIKYARGTGRSRTWAKAVANVGAPKFAAFTLDHKKSYFYQTIEAEILASAKKDVQSFVTGMEKYIEQDVLDVLGGIMAFDTFRDSTGIIAWVDATWGGASTTLPIAVPYNNVNGLEVGLKLVCAQDAASSLYDTGITLTILQVDATSVPPTIVVDSLSGHTQFAARAGNAIPLWVEGDYVSASDRLSITGMEAWIPPTAPTAGVTFKGVDRALDVRKLAGMRINRSTYSAEEALLDGLTEVRQFYPDAGDFIVVSPAYFNKLAKEQESKGYFDRTQGKTDAEIGYKRLWVGGAEVTQDPFNPDTAAWILTLDDWVYYWMGDAEAFLMAFDDSVLHPVPAATGTEYEIRAASWGDLGCELPGRQCRVTVAL